MQFSEQWLRTFVDPQLNSAELGHLLTMAGLEVEEAEPAAPAFKGVVVARIVEAVVAVEDNPDLAAEAEARLAAQDVFNVAVVTGPLVGGCESQGPYDAEQISDGGRVVAMFREGQLGVVRVGLKRDGRINWRFAFNAGAPVLPGFARPQGFVL